MKKETQKKLYLTTCEYNRSFILTYCMKQLEKNNSSFKLVHNHELVKLFNRNENGYNEKKFFCSRFVSWCSIYTGFIVNGSYYYYELDSNPFFEATFYRIVLDENNNYTGSRYAYKSNDLFTNYELETAIKINGFNNYSCYKQYSNKTLLKYARFYYENYFIKYFLNIRDSEHVYERVRVNNVYNRGYHYESIYDNKKYNIFKRF